MRIRNKFLITNLTITLVLGTMAMSVVLFSTHLLEQEVNGKYMAVANYAMEKVHRLFSRRFEDLKQLTDEPLLQSPAAPTRIARLLRDYQSHFKSYAPYADLAYFDRDQRYICDSENHQAGGRALPPGVWDQLQQGDGMVLEVSRAEAPGEAVFNLARAVRDGRGALTGAVLGRIPVGTLQMIAQRPLKLFKLGMPPALDLLDRNGRILYSSHARVESTEQIAPGYDLIRQAMAAGEGTGTLLYRGVSRNDPADIIIFAREGRDAGYPGNDWALTISVPEGQALASMIGLRQRLTLIIVAIGLFSIGLSVLLSRTITRPIARLSEAAAAVGAGRLDIAVPVTSGDEAGQLAHTFNTMVHQLNALNQELQIAATVDKLTGALNRNRTEQILQDELERSARYSSPLTLTLFDIDHFKQINDRHGHLAGDAVLKAVTDRVQQAIRATDTLGRWGGEEFLLLSPGTNLAQATRLAEKIRRAVADGAFDDTGPITVSCGVAQFSFGDSETGLIKKADLALYAAKRNGRNRVEISLAS